MRATSAKNLAEDLRTAALDLKPELLRFDRNLAIPEQSGATTSLSHSRGTRLDELLELLKVWLRTAEAGHSKILLILDDLDGLEPSELSKLSEMISGDHVEVIYSTRDP